MRQKKASTKRDLDSAFPLIRPNAAAMDIGSREHVVAVPEERSTPSVRSFGCTTSELREMTAWLKSCGVDTVAMEATGVVLGAGLRGTRGRRHRGVPLRWAAGPTHERP